MSLFAIPYLGPVLRVMKSVWDFVLGTVAEGFEWLRKPGHKLKAVTGVLAIVAAVASFKAYDRGQRILVITTACQTAANTCALEKTQLSDRLKDKDAALAAIDAVMREETKKLKALQQQNVDLQAEVARKTAAAEKSETAFAREYANRPATCTSALAMLAQACPTLGGY